MTIDKFYGKTNSEAIEKAKSKFGEDVIILNEKEIKPKGIFRIFKSSTYEVTAAMKERESYVSPLRQAATGRLHDSVNLAADEKIDLANIREETIAPRVALTRPLSHAVEDERISEKEKQLEERLDSLSDRLEGKLAASLMREETDRGPTTEELNFVRILYNTLIKNEVNEKYVNQVLDEIEQFIRPGVSVDIILSNVYQKLVLRFGQPKTIELGGKRPLTVFFIGPTGVGKTTTIAKIASKYKVEHNNKVAFITADTYRIAATDQLQTYANILDAPMEIVYSAQEMNEKLSDFSGYDLVFVDTAGFSHKNVEQKNNTKKLLQGLDQKYPREVYLVLSATTKYGDLLEIIDVYREISDFKLIFTKLDETNTYGNLLNVKLYSQADLSYATMGQNVPNDIEVFDTQKIVKQLLGGNS